MIRQAVLIPAGVLIVAAITLVALMPLTAPRRSARQLELAPEGVRTAFVRAGFTASQPSRWDDRTVSFMVRESSQVSADQPGLEVFVYVDTAPALRVFVFVDMAAAAAEHRRAHAREESRRGRPVGHGDDLGPQLLSGYGASVWRRNVALVQASPAGDLSTFPTEPPCPPEAVFTADTPERSTPDDTQPIVGVDRRFVDVLEALP
jgi:hypothetical protein